MAAVTHGRKPLPGAIVRYGHPLAHGLQFFVPFLSGGNSSPDLVSGKQWVFENDNVLFVPGRDGANALKTSSTIAGACRSELLYPDGKLNKDRTIFARGVATTSSATQTILSKTNGGQSVAFALYLDAANRLSFKVGNGSFLRAYNCSPAVRFNEPQSYSASFRDTTINPLIYFNGQSQTVANFVGSQNFSPDSSNAPIRIGGESGAAFWNGTIEVAAGWSRQLLPYEHEWLSDDPYDILRPRSKVYSYVQFPPRSNMTAAATVGGTDFGITIPFASGMTGVATAGGVAEIAGLVQASVSMTGVSSVGGSIYSTGSGVSYTAISSAADDGEITATLVTTSGTLTLNNTTVLYFRFQGVTFPRQAYIKDAHIIFTAQSTNNSPFDAMMYADRLDYSWVNTSTVDFALRPKTQAVTTTIPSILNESKWNSPQLAQIIQEIADYTDIRSPTAITFYMDCTSTSVFSGAVFNPYSRDFSATGAAVLLVEYGQFNITCSTVTMTAAATTSVVSGAQLLAPFPSGAAGFTCAATVVGKASSKLNIAAEFTGAATLLTVEGSARLGDCAMFAISTFGISSANVYGLNAFNLQALVTAEGQVFRAIPVPRASTLDFTDATKFQVIVSGVTLDVSS